MEKKRSVAPSNHAVGQYASIWAYLFTFLQVEERFANRRVCGWFKTVLDTPAAWRSIAIRKSLSEKADAALVDLRRRVPVEVSFYEVCYATEHSEPVREWGYAQLLTPKLRELVFLDLEDHEEEHRFMRNRDWQPCYAGLVALTLPWCLALQNSALLVQLQGLRSLVWTAYRNCDDMVGNVDSALGVIAQGLVPRLRHLGLDSRSAWGGDHANIDLDAARIFLPVASQLQSLSIKADEGADNKLVIDRPGLRQLKLSGIILTGITEATAKTLTRWYQSRPGFTCDARTLPNFPVLEEFDYKDSQYLMVEPVVHTMITKMPKVTRFKTRLFVGRAGWRPVELQGADIASLFDAWLAAHRPARGYPQEIPAESDEEEEEEEQQNEEEALLDGTEEWDRMDELEDSEEERV